MDTTRGIFPMSGEFRKVTVTFDSLYTQAEIGIRGSSQNLYQPLVLDYAKYRDLRYAHDMRKEFREITLKDFKAAGNFLGAEWLTQQGQNFEFTLDEQNLTYTIVEVTASGPGRVVR